MPVIVVTRLRLRDPALFDEFAGAAVAVTEQARSSDGNLASDLLADANNVYWTSSAWRDRDAMNAFVGTEPHLSTMPHSRRRVRRGHVRRLGPAQPGSSRLADEVSTPPR